MTRKQTIALIVGIALTVVGITFAVVGMFRLAVVTLTLAGVVELVFFTTRRKTFKQLDELEDIPLPDHKEVARAIRENPQKTTGEVLVDLKLQQKRAAGK